MGEPLRVRPVVVQVAEMKMSVITPESPISSGYPAEVAEDRNDVVSAMGKERCN